MATSGELDPRQRQEALAALLAAAEQLQKSRKLDAYIPFAKQREFHSLGATKRERLLMAGNRLGKSECAASEVAMHLTGLYPDWWDGYRLTMPNRWWIAGEDGTTVRDVQQKKLCGEPGVPSEHGTGYIPKDCFVGDPSRARGTTDLYDTYHIRHVSGGISSVTQKTYGEGRHGFQGDTLHGGWADEQAPDDVYSEFFTRLQTTQGIMIGTMTPLKGKTEQVKRFTDDPTAERGLVMMDLFDTIFGQDPDRPWHGLYTREQAEAILASYPAHERDARAYGVPQLGEGKVFLVLENAYKIERPQEVPLFWKKLWGFDFGGIGESSHPAAAALLAWDTDFDVLYLLHALRMQGLGRLQHIQAIRRLGGTIPVAWPHDMNEMREASAGGAASIAAMYRKPMEGVPGLLMLPHHATWGPGTSGGFSTAAAIDELNERMQTGRFKAVDDCVPFWNEVRMYHREKGLIVKQNDDVLSAIFKALMMKRYAKAGALGAAPANNRLARKEAMLAPSNPWTGA